MNFLCPICFELINEAHMTRCGHTFCYACLLRTIEQTARQARDGILKLFRSPGIDSARLHRLASRYDNPLPTRFLAPKDCSKIPAQLIILAVFWNRIGTFWPGGIWVQNIRPFADPVSEPARTSNMRSGEVVRGSDCQCLSRNRPGPYPSILRHSGI